ncbi:uncharacterized mitochondrial protein AtMg00310-like [Argentina anserina]|uniref:uncharacterized mitochondrial protein AtMg00310-like n=1 Tax=Argentina anserina TaxID=57926 RepID=UPI00217669BB|nr:uncharacterized mitochondrial protein AtMg00310-like [Potentilla anserina]
MARFWWGDEDSGKKIHWLSWEKLCTSKGDGGLGFRNMHLFNLSLLAKQGWKLVHQPDSFLARLLKARYFPKNSFMAAKLKAGESYAWRSIMAGRKVLKLGLRMQVGIGEQINVWSDPWMPMPSSFSPYSSIMEGT